MIPQLYFDKVRTYFLGDVKATWDWFKNANPALGSASPMDLLKQKQENKVIQHINKALKGERRL